MQHMSPSSVEELSEIVSAVYAAETPMTVIGRGTKSGWGRSVDHPMQLSLSGLRGIVDYAPAELVLTARAGTSLATIQQALKKERQHLAFEPIDLGPLFDHQPGQATLGGTLACNLSGARRPFAGAARDYFLGFSGVNGRGEIFKAGGKVVKNVTGYDLPKLMAGSFGTLALLAEVTIKVLPAPETSLSVVVPGLDVMSANDAMTLALGSTADPSGAAYLPESELAHLGLDGKWLPEKSATIFRLEGAEASVAYRSELLQRMLGGAATVLASDQSLLLWQALNTLSMFTGDAERAVWLLSVPPAMGAATIATLQGSILDLRYALDWGGGRIWLSVGITSPDASAATIRAAMNAGGHASLIKAPAANRADNHVYSTDVPIDLLRRVRAAFDPKRLFNRGRLHSEL